MITDAALVALALVAGCGTTSRLADLDTEVRDQAKHDKFSGVILIARHGVPELARAYGDRISLDTCFNLGSTSKVFTLVAIEQLVEAGTLRLDDRIGAYVTNFPSVADATIGQLLSHTSGLAAGVTPEFFTTISEKHTLEDMIAALAGPLDAVPGTRKQYSNIGFLLLGRVVEVVAHESFDAYVAEHISKPAGMTRTSPEANDCAAPLTRGMAPHIEQPLPARRAFLPPRGTSAGGWSATAGDLQRFADALRDHRLVKVEPDTMNFPLRAWDEHRMVGHNGGAPGINAEFWLLAPEDYSIIVLSNFDPPSATEIADRAAELITGSKPPVLRGKRKLLRR